MSFQQNDNFNGFSGGEDIRGPFLTQDHFYGPNTTVYVGSPLPLHQHKGKEPEYMHTANEAEASFQYYPEFNQDPFSQQQQEFNHQWGSVLHGQAGNPYIPGGEMPNDPNNNGRQPVLNGPAGQNLLNPDRGRQPDQQRYGSPPGQQREQQPSGQRDVRQLVDLWRTRRNQRLGIHDPNRELPDSWSTWEDILQEDPYPALRSAQELYSTPEEWVSIRRRQELQAILRPLEQPHPQPKPNRRAGRTTPQPNGAAQQQNKGIRKKTRPKRQSQQTQSRKNFAASPGDPANEPGYSDQTWIGSESNTPAPADHHLDPGAAFVPVDASQFTGGLEPLGGLPSPGWTYHPPYSDPPAPAYSGPPPDPAFTQLEGGKFPAGIPPGLEDLPIAPASSTRSRGPIKRNGMTKATGPMSRDVFLPPMPKPGRKPMEIEETNKVDRRKTQNRQAQRNFRDKRDQRLHDALAAIEMNKREYEDHIMELDRDRQDRVEKLQDQIRQLEERCSEMRTQLDEAAARSERQNAYIVSLERQISLGTSKSASKSVAESQKPAPSSDGRLSREAGPSLTTSREAYPDPIDFTSMYSRTRANQSVGMKQSLSSQSSDTMTGLDTAPLAEGCGFCKDQNGDLCECAQQRAMNGGQPAYSAGNCESCRADPERAQQCRQLASRAQSRPVDGDGDHPMSCATFMDQVAESGTRIETVSQLLNAEDVQLSTSNVAGFELNEHEAAKVLQSISKQ